MLQLMFITNEKSVALEAEAAGVDRIFIDLEVKGKYERQGHLDTYISNHKMEDIKHMKSALKKSEVLVRVNPFYEGTQREVDECIAQGADIIMLPMFKTAYEVEEFVKCIKGRAKVNLLLETSQAFVRINQILDIDGIDEIHIGLNDLHLSLGLDFMFEVLSEGLIEYLSTLIKKKGIKFGFGGIAKIGQGDVPSELIIGEHYRLGSEMVILSRAFRNDLNTELQDIGKEVKKIREVEKQVKEWSSHELSLNAIAVQRKVREVAVRKSK